MQVTCVIFNLTVDRFKKQVKFILIIFYLAPLFQHVINIKITYEIFHIFFHTKSSKASVQDVPTTHFSSNLPR